MNIRFVLITEGQSDDGLIRHLENLCLEAGADEVLGIAPDLSRLPNPPGRTLEAKILAVLQYEPNANLFLLHRDADSRNSVLRHEEIRRVIISCGLEQQWVAVVPVQETEAWLLLDENAIRTVANKPNGRTPLNLPRPAQVEDMANPKERLKTALATASELTGRRYQRFVATFSTHRRLLLHRLQVGGPLLLVPAWLAMKNAIEQAIQHLRYDEEPSAEEED